MMMMIRGTMLTALALMLVMSVDAVVDPRRSDISALFEAQVKGCPKRARVFLRCTFHAGGTFDKTKGDGGNTGAFQYELDRFENLGLDSEVLFYRKMVTDYNISFADAIAYGGVVAVKACGGPIIKFNPGRVDTAKGPGPEGRMPNPHIKSAETLAMFENRLGLSVEETVALVTGSHTMAQTPAIHGELEKGGFTDPTPAVFDNAVFAVVLAEKVPANVQDRIPADVNLAKDPRARAVMEKFAKDQQAFFDTFASAYVKMVNLGATFEQGTGPESDANISIEIVPTLALAAIAAQLL